MSWSAHKREHSQTPQLRVAWHFVTFSESINGHLKQILEYAPHCVQSDKLEYLYKRHACLSHKHIRHIIITKIKLRTDRHSVACIARNTLDHIESYWREQHIRHWTRTEVKLAWCGQSVRVISMTPCACDCGRYRRSPEQQLIRKREHMHAHTHTHIRTHIQICHCMRSSHCTHIHKNSALRSASNILLYYIA